ncbi:hypothetical protein BCR44DRAFT_1135201 [Catenaria anguillulae PL171]|uniref:Uncharacterized protein n=1 Tax=Catenaria anguillulae PL171 TaxID=765915 RepID=A0A1Y2H457_9FUNG|nr:hypothetical protein BCR44DRAFT_1135201 [Catenaria anguillulae PL171]
MTDPIAQHPSPLPVDGFAPPRPLPVYINPSLLDLRLSTNKTVSYMVPAPTATTGAGNHDLSQADQMSSPSAPASLAGLTPPAPSANTSSASFEHAPVVVMPLAPNNQILDNGTDTSSASTSPAPAVSHGVGSLGPEPNTSDSDDVTYHVVMEKLADANPGRNNRHVFDTTAGHKLMYATSKPNGSKKRKKADEGDAITKNKDDRSKESTGKGDKAQGLVSLNLVVAAKSATAQLALPGKPVTWKAALVPWDQIPGNLKPPQECNSKAILDALKAPVAVISGKTLLDSSGEAVLPMTFAVIESQKYFLVAALDDFPVFGLGSKEIRVQCTRGGRARNTNKKSAQPEDDINEPASQPAPEPADVVSPQTKRAKTTTPASSSLPPASTYAYAQPQLTTPPPSPDFGSQATTRRTLLDLISTTDHFNPSLPELLKRHAFHVADIHNAVLLLFSLHVRGDGSTWSSDNIVGTLGLLGQNCDVISADSWSPLVKYPYPLHAVASCKRPDLVNALLAYFHPDWILAQDARTACPPLSQVWPHDYLTCNRCRAFRVQVALALPNDKGSLPIHTAVRHRNTAFVVQHLRIMGADATFLRCDDSDGANFFHIACASLGAVDWLDNLWAEVIGDAARRRAAANALLTGKDLHGRTPGQVASDQLERSTQVERAIRQHTFIWVTTKETDLFFDWVATKENDPLLMY